MAVMSLKELRILTACRAGASASMHHSCKGNTPHFDEAGRKTTRDYRGSWAEQNVVARLARNNTPKATRMATTPPTVTRSQRSEFLFMSNSRFAAIGLVLITHSTEAVGICSDHGHNPILSPGSPLRHKLRAPDAPHKVPLSFFSREKAYQ